MRIYFTGSESSGKSTLCRYISKEYKLDMITEVARKILAEKELNLDSLRSNLDLVNSYQKEIFYRQIFEESKYESFVSDRSIIDAMAYTAQHSSILSELFYSEEFKKSIEELKKDDVYIFYIKPTKATLSQDGVRETLYWDKIIATDSMIKFMLELFNLRYFQINTDSSQERIKLIKSILR